MMNNALPRFNHSNYLKQQEKYILEKKSSGLGFYILSYILTMVAAQYLFLQFFLSYSQDNIYISNIPMFLINIFTSVFSAFIPGLFYFLISKSNISETISVKYVKQNILWPIVFMGMATAMVANYATDILQQNFSIFGIENTKVMSESTNTFFENILYFVSTAIVPAFAEEFAFRGIIMGTLRKYGDVFAIITSSVMFGIMHGNIVQIPFAFILGLVFAYIDCKTNSIIPSIIIHFINNFYSVMMDILRNSGDLNDRKTTSFYFLIISVFCILGIISFLYLINKDKNFFKLPQKSSFQYEYAKVLTLKDKIKAFLINPGIILVSVLLLYETISNIGVI